MEDAIDSELVSHLERVRKQFYSHLDGNIYLDVAGSPPINRLHVDRAGARLSETLLGNPRESLSLPLLFPPLI